MSAPINGREGQDRINEVLRYAPPWVRENPLSVVAREIANAPPMVPDGDPNAEQPPMPPRFEGDIAMEAVRRRRSLDPQAVPQPPLRMRRKSRMPWIFRLMMMLALAFIGAFGVMWLTAPDGAAPVDHGNRTVEAAMPVLSTKTARSVPSLAASRLVVVSQRGDVNEPLALGISLDGRASGETLLLAGFAEGTKLSAGSPLGRTGWRLPAADLGNVVAYAPQDFVGAMDAKADLRSASDRLMDSQHVRLEWVVKKPELRAVPGISRQTQEVPALQPLEADEVAALVKRGHELLKSGDIASARLLLRRAANAGDAQAALALGASFDGAFLAELGVLGVVRDEDQARGWYRRAADLGSAEAARRLERLEISAK